MRPVEFMVLFRSKECLLLSEWEADRVVQMMWATPPDQSKLTTLRKELYESIGALKVAPDPTFIEQRTQRKRRELENEQESDA